MMMGRNKKPPFNYSGTFASDADGWTVGSNTARSTSNPRTSPGALYMGGLNTTKNSAEYTLDKSVCGGLTITPSIWHRGASAGISVTRTLSYKIGAGSYVTLATVTDTSAAYAELTGSFDNPGNDDVTIRIEASYQSYWDDWSISGI